MVYKWRKGCYAKANADVAGAVCEQLEQTVGLTAKNLVEASRDENAPLHNEFEWDDSVASDEWRKFQARNIIAGLVIIKEDSAPVRKFFNIENGSPIYKSIDVILQSESETEKLLKMARGELFAFTKKYKQLSELSGVISTIEEYLGGNDE